MDGHTQYNTQYKTFAANSTLPMMCAVDGMAWHVWQMTTHGGQWVWVGHEGGKPGGGIYVIHDKSRVICLCKKVRHWQHRFTI